MNKIITLLLLLAIILPDLAAQNRDAGADTAKPTTIRLRCRSTLVANEPLLVVNGVAKKFDQLKALDPKDIAEIHILKDAAATAIYGCRASSGVIVITVKEQRRYQVRDKFTGNAIPFAGVRLIAKADTVIARADKNGLIKTTPMNPYTNYVATVDAEGYRTQQFDLPVAFATETKELFLSKDITATKNNTAATAIFPNPVLKGTACTIEWTNSSTAKVNVVITDMTGLVTSRQVVQSNKGLNRVACNTTTGVKTGTYCITLVDESGTVISRNKLTIQ